MLVFYNTATSPNGQKVRLMLEECGLPYQLQLLRRDTGETRAPEYLAISPTGAVPALLDPDNEAVLFESAAILVYLGEKSGRFLPVAQPQRADVLKWLFYEVASVGAACENIYQLSYVAEPGHWMQVQIDKMKKAASLLEQQIDGQEYICGECSIVDFALLPWMVMFEDLTEVPLHDYPGLQRWCETMQNRPATARVLAGQ